MKVLSTQINLNKNKNLSFAGMQKNKNVCGIESYTFYLPYDTSTFDAYLELVKVDKTNTLDWEIPKNIEPKEIKLSESKITINPNKYFAKNENFGYRFKLVNKNNKKVNYHHDAGVFAKNTSGNATKEPTYDEFSVVIRSRASHNKNGQMMHITPDNYNPGYMFDKSGKIIPNNDIKNKAVKSTRTHFNQLGGNIAGIVDKVDKLEKMGVRNLLSTPIFGMDELSSHGYWTTNPFQVSTQQGTQDDFKMLQVELFKHNMNLVADGAFVNEGLEGIHLKHILKWGEKSPYASWFKAYDLKSSPLSLGVIPNDQKDSDVFKNIQLKFVNPKGANYNPKKPTFVQLYDKRLVSDEQVSSNEIIRHYDKLNPKNSSDIMSHNDSVIPYAFEVDPLQLNKNIKIANEKFPNKSGKDYIKSVLKFDNFSVVTKAETNLHTWDGNVDIAKLNYMYSGQDDAILSQKGVSEKDKQEFIKGGYQVQDYIQSVGSFWTKETKGALIEHTLKQFKGKKIKNDYKKAIKTNELPKDAQEVMTDDVIDNVLNDKYDFKIQGTKLNSDDYIVSNLMDYPLESIEFSPDLTAVLGAPYISKRAFNKDDVGKSRFETYSNDYDYEKMPENFRDTYKAFNNLYSNSNNNVKSIKDITKAVINRVQLNNSDLDLINKDGKVTQLGELIIPLIAPKVMKFAMVASLSPDAISINDNKISYNFEKLREVGLNKLGIIASSPKEEANQVINKVKQGLSNISNEQIESFGNTIVNDFINVSAHSVKMAYALVDRTESGLNWRIDAAKDVADIDYIRSDNDNVEKEWDKVIDFWKTFTDSVRKENPNSYIVAEVTDLNEFSGFINNEGGSKYKNDSDAAKKFIQETGMSTLSNYSYFFSSIPRIESKVSDTQPGARLKHKNIVEAELSENINNLLYSTMVNSANHTHNFFGNHDKPRILHVLALDMNLYNEPDVHKKPEYEGIIKHYAPNNKAYISSKALATAQVLESAFCDALKDNNVNNHTLMQEQGKYLQSIRDFVAGEFGDPELFATKPLEKAISETINHASVKYNLNKDILGNNIKLEDKVLKALLLPAMEKYKRILNILTILPGNPTMYAGDELGQTGFEYPNKNIYVHNRNALNWKWLDDPSKDFIKTYHDEITKIANKRQSKDFKALSIGETVVCDVYDSHKDDTIAFLRYDEDSTLLCLATSNGSVDDPRRIPKIDKDMTVETVKISTAGGIKDGTEFVNPSNIEEKYEVMKSSTGDYLIKNIKMKDNTLVLKALSFKGGQTANFLKIKGYLGSNSFVDNQVKSKVY